MLCTIFFSPVRLLCAKETGSMLKNWKIAKVNLFQNGNGNFVPFMELKLGKDPWAWIKALSTE